MSDSSSAPLYYERLVAELLGISRQDLIYLRKEHLKKNDGWRLEGRDVVYSQGGLAALLLKVKASLNAETAIDLTPALVIAPEPSSAAAEKKEGGTQSDLPAAPRPELVELTVKRCYPNVRLLQALAEDGSVVDVRVPNNRNFVPKMKLRARLNAAGKYELEGRCPRSRGRY